MNREDIIRMAREAGLHAPEGRTYILSPTIHPDDDLSEYLERFAALVASAEREACAKIAEIPDGEYEVVVTCGTEPTLRRIPKYLNWQDIVKAIRARGQA